jgi:hypothetical protein
MLIKNRYPSIEGEGGAGAGAGAGGAGGGEGGAGTPKVYDQAYVDRLRSENAATVQRAKEAQAKLDEIETARKKLEADALAEQGNFKKLHEETQRELAKEKAKNENMVKEQQKKTIAAEVISQAKTAGLRDEAIAKLDALVDSSKFAIAEDGNVTGVKEAIEALIAEMPFLKGESTTTLAKPGAGDGRLGGAAPARAGAGGAKVDMRDRTAVADPQFKSAWDGLGKTG